MGVLEVGDTSIDLLVERAGSPTAPVWLISSNSLAALSQAGEIAAPRIVDRWLPAELRERKAWGAPVGDWLAMGAIAAGAYGFAWLVVWVLTKINALWRHFRRDESKALFSALATPARLLIALALLAVVSTQVGISIVVREQLGAVLQLIGWTVFAWLLLRTVDVLTTVMIGRLQRKGRGHVASIGLFLGRLAKGAVVVIGVLAVVDTLGYDVTTGLAALGIGGLALALGAQKVVENLVASVSILADRPVRLGEFCKIGDTMGTVEEIGIRSTKLRTLDHTLVVIPNSEFAAKQLENFSRRNRFWFHPVLNIDYRTPPSRIETLLSALRSDLGQMEGFVEHPRVRLLGLAADRLPIEIFGYVDTADNDRFLEFQEAATLRILRLANEIAVTLVPPGVAVYQGGADPAVGEEHKQS